MTRGSRSGAASSSGPPSHRPRSPSRFKRDDSIDSLYVSLTGTGLVQFVLCKTGEEGVGGKSGGPHLVHEHDGENGLVDVPGFAADRQKEGQSEGESL